MCSRAQFCWSGRRLTCRAASRFTVSFALPDSMPMTSLSAIYVARATLLIHGPCDAYELIKRAAWLCLQTHHYGDHHEAKKHQAHHEVQGSIFLSAWVANRKV